MGIIAIFSAAEIQFFRTKGKDFFSVIKEIAFSYEFGDKFCFRIMVNRIGVIVLLNFPIVHNNDTVAHGEGFFLIVGDEYESKTEFFLQVFQFDLERFAELVIKSAEGLKRSIFGLFTKARATATRCCCPPDICAG